MSSSDKIIVSTENWLFKTKSENKKDLWNWKYDSWIVSIQQVKIEENSYDVKQNDQEMTNGKDKKTRYQFSLCLFPFFQA